MTYFTTAVILSSVFYALVSYISFVTASILHNGIIYRLVIPVVKSTLFIAFCYISIISDVIMFRAALYEAITIKNGFLLLLVATSLMNARDGKEIKDEHSRE
ncbi:hypothetical protein D3C76_1327430 [compost metagenome]